MSQDLLGFDSYWSFQGRYAVTKRQKMGAHSFNQVIGYRNLDELAQRLKTFSFRVTKENVFITLKKKEARNLKVNLKYNGPIKAPIKKDQKIANIDVLIKDKVVKSVPVYASKEVEKVNFFKSLFMSINYLIWGDV